MESNQHARPQAASEIRHLVGSNAFTRNANSRMYESFNLQTSALTQQDRTYDPEYRSGFPKLYSFDTSVPNKSRISLD